MSYDTPVNSSFGGQYPMRICEGTLTVAAEGNSATFTSASKFRGYIQKIEVAPGDMATSATLKIYEANSPLTTPDYFLNLTFPASQVERVIYPRADAALKNDGTALTTTVSEKYVVCDNIKVDLASAAAADSVKVRIYVRG